MKTNKQLRDEINAHREAVGRRKITTDARRELEHHFALINLSAPYGRDPWEIEPQPRW